MRSREAGKISLQGVVILVVIDLKCSLGQGLRATSGYMELHRAPYLAFFFEAVNQRFFSG